MPRVINKFNWGSALVNQNPLLVRQLDEAYTDTALVLNGKVSKYVTDGKQKPHVDAPATSQLNKNFEQGDIYVRADTNTAWIMTSRTNDVTVNWQLIT